MPCAIEVLGGGPAGSSAVLAALLEGSAVKLFEKSRFPRHKVCGEFLSPEIAPVLDQLGVWHDFQALHPARIRRLVLRFRSREKRAILPECAFGLSRYRFDHLLLEAARARGADVVPELHPGPAHILAGGRKFAGPRGRRLFGFTAHFEGPVDDAVELYFFGRFYVGVSTVEDGITNVCGLGPEDVLRSRRFDVDEIVDSFAPLRDRLRPLKRTIEWLKAGPLLFENRLHRQLGSYRAGDSLSFVDPFTGSGLLSAVVTGRLAGIAVARNTPIEEYLNTCRSCLEKPFEVSSIFRKALASGWAEPLAGIVPARWLVRWTRPHV